KRHVLALGTFMGMRHSNYLRRRLFGIGGVGMRDVVVDVVTLTETGNGLALRGLPTAPMVGNALASESLEYRFPLIDLELGYYTLPFFIRSIHGVAFLDAAAIADSPVEWRNHLHASAGGELRIDLALAYFLPLTARFGWGHGLGQDRVHNTYMIVGSNF